MNNTFGHKNNKKEHSITKELFIEIEKDHLKDMNITKMSDILMVSKIKRMLKDSKNEEDILNIIDLDFVSNSPSLTQFSNSTVVTRNCCRYEMVSNLGEFLQDTPTGKVILEDYKKFQTVDRTKKKELINLIALDIIQLCGYYPNLDYVKNAADSIVLTFPSMGITISENDALSSDHLFSRHGGANSDPSGSLYWRIARLRQKLLSPSKKKNRKREMVSNKNMLIDKANSPIKKIKTSTDDQEEFDVLGFTNSFGERNLFTKNNTSLETVFEKYPYTKYNGKLILLDFSQLKIGTICTCFLSKKNFFLTMKEAHKFQGIKDETLRIMCILADTLNSKNVINKKRWSSENLNIPPSFLKIIKDGENIEKIMVKNKHMHPHLIFQGNINNDGIFYLCVEQNYIYIGSSSIDAMNVLFSSHFVFNLKYGPPQKKFFAFCEIFYFKLKTKCKIPIVLDILKQVNLYEQSL